MTKTKIRKTHSAAFKYKVALAALKDDKTMSQLVQEFGVHSTQINKWKNCLKESGHSLFEDKKVNKQLDTEKTVAILHEKIGQLTVENDFLARVLNR